MLKCLTEFAGIFKPCTKITLLVQTVEARENYYNRSLGAIKAGGNFIQTSFPNVAQLPTFAYSVKGSSNTTYTSYTVCPCLIDLHLY